MMFTHRLPERKENDQLDTQDLQEWPVFGQVCLKLQVELDQEEHGEGYSNTLKDHGPNVSKGRIQ